MNEAAPHLFRLLFGTVALLTFATLIARGLRARAGPERTHTGIENLNARIDAWWGMAALLGLSFLAGKGGVILLFAFISFAALREFLTLTTKRAADHWALFAAFFLVLPVQFWLVWDEWYGFYSIFIPVYAVLLLPVVSVLGGDTRDAFIRIAETQWALMICVYCVSHVPALLTLRIEGFEGREVLLIAWLVIVVQMSDVLQYTCGKLVGKTRIAPRVSPSKTWEGMIGGIALATALGAALFWITPFSPVQAAGMALAVTLMGFFGGLVLSAVKRDRGIKDWGHLIAGHGGFIDRMDSVVFAAPIFFHLTRYFWSTV
ncbi:phosphatidate cytidylyltransferase [Vannielia sp.]|uniref:phosphatidate cytidylyltransferase n=1 Tax=Vannielia sp. TaxID=2813045 RepID=UPI00260D6BBA|nr:phosphatidate cytidylyltransferase [Vannielia sp.]MDF1873499.1 phosphatidate cytidylyltransferase [Vannielia sp.]